MDWQNLFLSAQGRIGRKDFWIGAGALVVANLIGGAIPLAGALISLALIYPWTCLAAKRLHDFGRSGWLVIVAAAPAAVSGTLALVTSLAASNVATMGVAFAGAGLTLMVSGVALLASLGFLLWVGLKPGNAGANTYGPALAVTA